MNSKGFLFTIITFLLLFAILLYAKAYVNREIGLDESVVILYSGTRFGEIEDDVISGAYRDLLSVNLAAINKTSLQYVIFDAAQLTYSRNYSAIMNNYKSYVENTYSSLNGVNITLSGFNNTFVIQPYNTRVQIDGQTLYIYFASPYTDVSSIRIYAKTDSKRQGNCGVPLNDGVGTLVTVTYQDRDGFICTDSAILSPTENNDKGGGRQFDLSLKEPIGSIDVKFGQIGGINGIFAVLPVVANFNITRLDIAYTLPSSRVYIEAGSFKLKSSSFNLTKTSKIILAEE